MIAPVPLLIKIILDYDILAFEISLVSFEPAKYNVTVNSSRFDLGMK